MTAATRSRVVPTRSGPGRPRAAGHDHRILAAAVSLIDRGDDVTVTRVVELSGISRAAIYRRWPSMTDLIAAALDHGRTSHEIPTDGDLLENVLRAYSDSAGSDFPEARFRMRLKLAMTDRKIAVAYWRSHAAKRRSSMEALLQAGIERGQLRPDIDIEACIDAINGVFYYQVVVRGTTLNDPETLERCRHAVRTIWRGMSVAEPRIHLPRRCELLSCDAGTADDGRELLATDRFGEGARERRGTPGPSDVLSGSIPRRRAKEQR